MSEVDENVQDVEVEESQETPKAAEKPAKKSPAKKPAKKPADYVLVGGVKKAIPRPNLKNVVKVGGKG